MRAIALLHKLPVRTLNSAYHPSVLLNPLPEEISNGAFSAATDYAKNRFSSAGALPCYFSFVAPLSLQLSIPHSNPTWPPALIKAPSKSCNGDLLDCKTFLVHCGCSLLLKKASFSWKWGVTPCKDCLVALSSAFLSWSTHHHKILGRLGSRSPKLEPLNVN